MGFVGPFGIVIPLAVFKIAGTLWWIRQTLVSLGSLLLGKGWTESEGPQIDGFGFSLPMEAGLRAADIRASIPVVQFGDISNKFANDDCLVCLCNFTPQERVWQTPQCSHVFHEDCLDRWMTHHQTTCPLCRSSLGPIERPERRTLMRSICLWKFPI